MANHTPTNIKINHIKIYKNEVDSHTFLEYLDMPHAILNSENRDDEFIVFYTINKRDIQRVNKE